MNNIVKDISGQIDIEVVTTRQQLDDMIAQLRESDVISVDTETTSLDPTTAKIVGLPLAISKDRAWYVPIGHKPHPVLDLFAGEPRFPLEQQLDWRVVLEALQPIMASKLLVMHNAKYDYLVLKSNGFTFPDGFHLLHDTMIGVRMIDQNVPASLKWLTEHFLKRKVTRYNELPHSIAESTIEDAAKYGGADPANTWALYKQQASLFPATVAKVFYDIEMPLVAKLADMEAFGILVDRAQIEPLRQICMEEIAKAKDDAQKVAMDILKLLWPNHEMMQNYRLDVASPSKLSKFLTMVGIPIPEEFAPDFDDPDAEISTAKKVLQTVRARLFDSEEPKDVLICKLIDAIMRYREHDKVRSTYIDSLLAGHMRTHKEAEDGEAVDSMGGGRLHTSYRQIGAKSGRFSSRPNLQNLPRNKRLDVRGVLIPDPGMIFVKADWNAIELRLAASVSKDQVMLDLMNGSRDSHAYTAAMIHGMPYEQFLEEWNKLLLERWDKMSAEEQAENKAAHKLAKTRNQQRDDAKTTSFLMLYQGGARTLALNLTTSTGRLYTVQSCQAIIDGWFRIYTGIKGWIEAARDDIAFKGYAETIFGRRLIVGQNPSEDQLRTGVNMIIQGSAVDILKQSLNRADKIWKQSAFPIRTMHHIHDEIIVQTKDEPECIRAAMEGLDEAMTWNLGNVELTKEIVAVRSLSKSEKPVAKL